MESQINYAELKISLVVFGTLVFFYLYYYFAHSEYIKSRFNSKSIVYYELKLFIFRKVFGFLVLGIIPGLLYFMILHPTVSPVVFFKGNSPSGFFVTLILVCIIALLTFINQKSNPQRNSLQMKIKEWNISLFGINAFGWIIYLLAYEFLFRGILLFECYVNFGFWPAIAINVVIYSAIHMINSKEEAIGALLFGTIASYFALQQGTILIPVIMHIALSLSSDYFSIKINKDLKFIKP
ncbi:MAG: CPBP family intramembrane metalloprotease [Prolixibacteraceae bacterium]|nr:CPBP family intramembrane metalloprotease [Prolixibacteraceae bacterium]